MAIKSSLVYAAACDVCGEEYDNDEYAYHTAEAALREAHEGDWWATETLVLCSLFDAEHLERAREYGATLEAVELDEFLEYCPDDWRDQIAPKPRFDAHMPGQTTIALTPAGA